MPEPTAVPQQTQARRTDSGDKTTATSLTAAGCGAFLLWIFGMIDAGRFYVPPVETAMFMGAAALPIMQALGKRWIKEIERGPDCGRRVSGKAPRSQTDEKDNDEAQLNLPLGGAAG